MQDIPPVATTNIFSRLLCFWLLPLLWSGGKKKLTIDDCGIIPEEFGSKTSGDALYNALHRTSCVTVFPYIHASSLTFYLFSEGRYYLLKASFRVFGFQFLAPILPRLLLLLATFGQPLLVNQIISFISGTNRPVDEGWALVGGFICIYAIIVFATSLYWEKVGYENCHICSKLSHR